MGRPPSRGGTVFRFTQAEVAEMEALVQQLNNAIPHRTVMQALAHKFTAARAGQIAVQPKQVCNSFQNRKYSQGRADTGEGQGPACRFCQGSTICLCALWLPLREFFGGWPGRV